MNQKELIVFTKATKITEININGTGVMLHSIYHYTRLSATGTSQFQSMHSCHVNEVEKLKLQQTLAPAIIQKLKWNLIIMLQNPKNTFCTRSKT